MSTPLGGATPSQQGTPVQTAEQTQQTSPAARMGPVAAGKSIKKGISSMEDFRKVAPKVMDAMMKSMASSICSKMKESQDRQKKISRGS